MPTPRDTPPLTANEALLDRIVRHAVYLEGLKTSEARRILRFLDSEVYSDVLAALDRRLANIATRGFDTGPHTTRRLRDLLTTVDGIVIDGMGAARRMLTDGLIELARDEAAFTAGLLRNVPPVALDFTAPSPGLLRSVVTDRPFEGQILRDWWSGVQRSTQVEIRRAVQLGITEGQGTQAIVRRVRRGAFRKPRHQVESVVRTAVNHTTTHAREATYAENADLVKGVRWVATLDDRTTVICASLDGQVFPVDEGQRPPAHFGCRSTTVPVLKSWRELGIDLDEAPEGTRASMDGQVPGDLTYPEWLRRQPREVQNDVLGVERARLWREGKVEVSGFVNRGQTLTLEQIRAREGLPVVKYNPKGKDTLEQWSDGKGNWAPDRQAKHNRIVEDALRDAPPREKPVYHMMGGGPASGKSSVIKSGDVELPPGHVMIDADQIKKRIPEYQAMTKAKDGNAAAFAHEESSFLSKRIIKEAGDKRAHTVLDGTGDSSFEKLSGKVRVLKDRGYRTVGSYVTVDTKEALARNLARAEKTGRLVPPEFVAGTHANISRIFPRIIKEGLFDELTLWDTNTPGQVIKVMEYVDGRTTIFNRSLWQRFLAKANDAPP